MPEVIFNGPAGRLEGRYYQSKLEKPPVALVLHPHPLHGGTMNNKVAYTLFKAFVNNGFSVLRFNFRGVGKSEGSYDEGVGELADATCAMDWVQSQNKNSGIFWIGGFSFGAWVSMQLMMRRPEIMSFVSIAPPANKYDFTFLSPCTASGMIIQGSEDTIVPEKYSAGLADKLSMQKYIEVDYKIINKADHFFRDKMDLLDASLNEYIQERLELDVDIASKRRVGKRRRKSRKSRLKTQEGAAST